MPKPVIHSLNCATMCPHGAVRLGILDREPGKVISHCLLIENGDGLILVDTGFGTKDIADHGRLGPARHLLAPRYDPAETAVAQVRALGYDPADVRDILVTHLDIDHAGGLSDFPHARVHVDSTELEQGKRHWRYRRVQWEHGPDWAPHSTDGEPWMGFPHVRPLEGAAVEIGMIALPGHTLGHSGYVIRTGGEYIVHCGDAYVHRSELDPAAAPNRAREFYSRVNAVDDRRRRENVARLSELARTHDEVHTFCAHDPHDLERIRALNAPRQ